MTSAHPAPARRTSRVLLDIALRAGLLVAAVAVAPALSGETDALALGLTAFFALAVLSFVVALLDGMFQRDRVVLVVVWVVVVPLVAQLELADHLRTLVTGPGAHPGLQEALAASWRDLPGSFVLFALLVGVPAAAGIGLGLLLRPVTPVTTAPVRATGR